MEQLKAMAVQNAAARNRITSLTYEQEWVNESNFDPAEFDVPTGIPKGRRIYTGKGTYVRKGDYFRSEWRTHDKVLGTNYLVEGHFQAVRNRNQYIEVHQRPNAAPGEARIHVFELPASGAPSRNVSGLMQAAIEPDPLLFGFTTAGGSNLEYLISLHPGKLRWTIDRVQDESGAEIDKLSMFVRSKASGKERCFQYFISPTQEFLFTGSGGISEDGEVWSEEKVDLQLLDDGHWFPSEVVETRSNGLVFRWKIFNVQINCPIDDGEFEFAKLHFDPYQALMTVHSKDGLRATKLQFVDGQWVPARPPSRDQSQTFGRDNPPRASKFIGKDPRVHTKEEVRR